MPMSRSAGLGSICGGQTLLAGTGDVALDAQGEGLYCFLGGRFAGLLRGHHAFQVSTL